MESKKPMPAKETHAQAKWRLEVELAWGLNELQCAVQRLEKTVADIQQHFRLRTFDELTDDPDLIPF